MLTKPNKCELKGLDKKYVNIAQAQAVSRDLELEENFVMADFRNAASTLGLAAISSKF